MTIILQDLRQAFRRLVKKPGFATTAIITIALGIGGGTAIYSVVRGVLLKPLPFEDPDRLVTLDVMGTRGFHISLSIPNYIDWRDRNRSFSSFGASTGWDLTLSGEGPAQIIRGRAVLGDFFAVLGIDAALGRVIPAPETEPGAENIVVLSHGFWQQTFGGDPAIVGRTITLQDAPVTVVGVLDRGVGFPNAGVDAYFPMGVMAERLPWDNRGSSFGTRAIARLAPGVTSQAAQSDMDRVGREVRELEGEDVAVAEIRSLNDFYVGNVRSSVWILVGAVVFVLLISTANVANLLLARGETRRRDLAVMSALGAGRHALVRAQLVESLLISGIGGVAGIALAYVSLPMITSLLAGNLSLTLLDRVAIDGGVLAFAAVLSVVTGVAFGILPALRNSQLELYNELRNQGRGSDGGGNRTRSVLVIAEVALALVLLVGAGLMMRALQELTNVDKGFEAENVLAARITLPRETYTTKESWLGFQEELLERVDALPGVTASAVTLLLPLADRSWEMSIFPADVPFDREQAPSVLFGIVSSDYFAVLGVPLVEGRSFSNADRDGTILVAIIDETMAERFWPGESAVGKQVNLPFNDAELDLLTVVGVARNVRHYELQSPSRIQVYVPVTQSGARWGMSMNVIVKTVVPPTNLAESLRREVAEIDSEVPVSQLSTMERYVDNQLSTSRALQSVLILFGAVAFALSGIGIFGVMSYTVAQRTREIGIRVALGAQNSDILKRILGQGMMLVATGIGIGLASAAGLTRYLESVLFQVSPMEPAVYAGAVVFLTVVAFLAAYLPARRATRVDPVLVLKEEV